MGQIHSSPCLHAWMIFYIYIIYFELCDRKYLFEAPWNTLVKQHLQRTLYGNNILLHLTLYHLTALVHLISRLIVCVVFNCVHRGCPCYSETQRFKQGRVETRWEPVLFSGRLLCFWVVLFTGILGYSWFRYGERSRLPFNVSYVIISTRWPQGRTIALSVLVHWVFSMQTILIAPFYVLTANRWIYPPCWCCCYFSLGVGSALINIYMKTITLASSTTQSTTWMSCWVMRF